MVNWVVCFMPAISMNSEDCLSRCHAMWSAGLCYSMWRQQFPPEHPNLTVWVHGSTPHSDNLVSHTVISMFVGGYIVLNCSGSNGDCVILHNQCDYLLRIGRFKINYSQIHEKFCILFCVWICRCIVKSDFSLKFSSIWQSCA